MVAPAAGSSPALLVGSGAGGLGDPPGIEPQAVIALVAIIGKINHKNQYAGARQIDLNWLRRIAASYDGALKGQLWSLVDNPVDAKNGAPLFFGSLVDGHLSRKVGCTVWDLVNGPGRRVHCQALHVVLACDTGNLVLEVAVDLKWPCDVVIGSVAEIERPLVGEISNLVENLNERKGLRFLSGQVKPASGRGRDLVLVDGEG